MVHQRISDEFHLLRDEVAPGYQLSGVLSPVGDFSNVTRIVTFEKPGFSNLRFLVKRYGPGHRELAAYAEREYAALRLLALKGVPAPGPVLLDRVGSVLGSPGIVTTVLDGIPSLDYRDDPRAIKSLAKTLASIHDVTPSAVESAQLMDADFEAVYFLRGADWFDRMSVHPDGNEIWRVCDELSSQMTQGPRRLVHLDFWSGNLLWVGWQLSGVVDWEEAAVGDPLIDLAYFRLDLRNVGGEQLVDLFTDAYAVERGVEIDDYRLAYWDCAAAARPMPDPVNGLGQAQLLGDRWSSAETLRNNLRTHISKALLTLFSA